MIARLLESKISHSPKSVLLLGPRQVGKSTLMATLKPEMTINLANQREYLAFSKNPDELEERISSTHPRIVFIDEIQRIPNLLNTIQDLVDRNRGRHKFLLTGSSARKLKRGSANLLPGRLFTYRLGPLSCAELGFKMDDAKALKFGTMPEPYLNSESQFSEKLLRSYAGTYLQEEILAETMLRDIQGFSRFLSVAAENSGKFLDFSKLAHKSQVSRSAARRYFEILEDTLICDRADPFELDGGDLVKHPKYYFFDGGVLNGCLENFEVSADRVGPLFEHLFFNQLKNTAYALDESIKISHFRTRGGLEVDFIIRFKSKIFAVELKTSEPSASELRGIKAIKDYLPASAERMVGCLKCVPKRKEGVDILPWQQVIRKIFNIPV